ncbi:MAG: hypothetical protein LC772_12010, partial [Chloroflexi bacterium]|nr:hypothetical protein [Chloroflexota bacterium]
MSSPTTAKSGAPRRLTPSGRNDAIALAVIILIPLTLLGSCLVGGQALAPAQQLQHFRAWRDASQTPPPWDVMMWDDLAQLLPWQAEARRSVLENRVPLWNADDACGTPLLANSQTSGLSPAWLLFQSLGIARAQAWLAWFQLALAGAGMYGFLRHFGLRAVPALFGGLTYELSGWSLAWIEFPNRHGPVAWLPLSLLLLAKSIHGGWRWRMGCAAAVAVSVLSSHLQFEFYLFLGLALAAVMLPFSRSRAENAAEAQQEDGPGDGNPVSRPPGTWRWIAGLGLIVSLAVLLAAPQLLPSVELGKHSYRLAQVSWSAYRERMSFALPAWRLAQAFVPGFFGYPSLGTVPSFVLPGTPPVAHFSADFYEFCLFTGTAPL